MDVRSEALRLATVATVFVWVGWFFVIYSIVAGIFWFIDLTASPDFNILQALGLSLAAIGAPIFISLIVAGMGHFMRLFALWAGSSAAEA